MLLRGSNGVGYANYPDNVVREFIVHSSEAGMDVFRIFDSLNYLPNLKVAMETVSERTNSLCEAALCYTGDFTDPKEEKYVLNYYVDLAKELEKWVLISLRSKIWQAYAIPLLSIDWSRHCVMRFHCPYTSILMIPAVLPLPLYSRHQRLVWMWLILQFLPCLAVPANPTLIPLLMPWVAPRSTGLDVVALNELSIYWEAVRQYYARLTPHLLLAVQRFSPPNAWWSVY